VIKLLLDRATEFLLIILWLWQVQAHLYEAVALISRCKFLKLQPRGFEGLSNFFRVAYVNGEAIIAIL
jgi:hypothetical protein